MIITETSRKNSLELIELSCINKVSLVQVSSCSNTRPVIRELEKLRTNRIFYIFQDRGIPSLNSTTTLVVKVEDQSDQPPEFLKTSYRADIDENAPVVGSD